MLKQMTAALLVAATVTAQATNEVDPKVVAAIAAMPTVEMKAAAVEAVAEIDPKAAEAIVAQDAMSDVKEFFTKNEKRNAKIAAAVAGVMAAAYAGRVVWIAKKNPGNGFDKSAFNPFAKTWWGCAPAQGNPQVEPQVGL